MMTPHPPGTAAAADPRVKKLIPKTLLDICQYNPQIAMEFTEKYPIKSNFLLA